MIDKIEPLHIKRVKSGVLIGTFRGILTFNSTKDGSVFIPLYIGTYTNSKAYINHQNTFITIVLLRLTDCKGNKLKKPVVITKDIRASFIPETLDQVIELLNTNCFLCYFTGSNLHKSLRLVPDTLKTNLDLNLIYFDYQRYNSHFGVRKEFINFLYNVENLLSVNVKAIDSNIKFSIGKKSYIKRNFLDYQDNLIYKIINLRTVNFVDLDRDLKVTALAGKKIGVN